MLSRGGPPSEELLRRGRADLDNDLRQDVAVGRGEASGELLKRPTSREQEERRDHGDPHEERLLDRTRSRSVSLSRITSPEIRTKCVPPACEASSVMASNRRVLSTISSSSGS